MATPRVLVVCALQTESTSPHVHVVGVGKVQAAASLASLIAQYRPSNVLAIGTCGSLVDYLEPGQLVSVVESLQHDADDIQAVAGSEPPQYRLMEILQDAHRRVVCATGDQFVTTAEDRDRLARRGAHVVDMETYAMAAVCAEFGVGFASIRVVTDTGSDSVEDWRASLAMAAETLAGASWSFHGQPRPAPAPAGRGAGGSGRSGSWAAEEGL